MFTKKLMSFAVVCAMGIGIQARAETTALDPKAVGILKKVGDTLRNKKAFKVDVEMQMKITGSGINSEMTFNSKVALKRPNMYANRLKAAVNGMTVVCDGKKLYIYLEMLKKYTEEDAPETLAELLDNPMIADTGLAGFYNFLLAEDPGESIMEGVTKCSYGGTAQLGEIECHVINGEQEDMSWVFWVSTGERPQLLQIVPDMGKAMAKAAEGNPMLKDMKQELTIAFRVWDFAPKFDETTFKFELPEGVEKMGSFFGVMGNGNKDHELIGKDAPQFMLPIVDGEDIKLSDYSGKKVVILDFWATWCGPCVSALPKIAEVADQFKDKDVVLVAVNQRESAEKIDSFLEKKGLQLTCAMDMDGSVGDLYKVKGIPQTVVIGKDGKVAHVHVGFVPGMEEQLVKELNELLK